MTKLQRFNIPDKLNGSSQYIPSFSIENQTKILGITIVLLMMGWSGAARAADGDFTGFSDVITLSAGYLAKLFVLAVIIENGLAVIFNWRVFLTYFSLRGVRTLVSVAVSWLIVVTFDINLIKELLEAYTGEKTGSYFGAGFLTALVLAGGSSGINNIMRSLGYRDASRDPQLPTAPSRSKAWVSVKVIPEKIRSEALIQISRSTDEKPPGYATAGMCLGTKPSLWRMFFPSNDRFPRTGGYELDPDVAWTIQVIGKDKDGASVSSEVTPEPIVLAEGAILDLHVKV